MIDAPFIPKKIPTSPSLSPFSWKSTPFTQLFKLSTQKIILGCFFSHIPKLILLALLSLFLSSIRDKRRKSFLITFSFITPGSIAPVTGKQALIISKIIHYREFWGENVSKPLGNVTHPYYMHLQMWWWWLEELGIAFSLCHTQVAMQQQHFVAAVWVVLKHPAVHRLITEESEFMLCLA